MDANPPGFYPDGTGVLRYWDGSNRTDQTKAMAAPASPQPPDGAKAKKGGCFKQTGIVVVGVFVALALLLGGCIALISFGASESLDQMEEQDEMVAETVELASCALDDAGTWWVAAGSLENPLDERGDVFIEVTFVDADGVNVGSGTARVENIEPGQAAQWDATLFEQDLVDISCSVADVNFTTLFDN